MNNVKVSVFLLFFLSIYTASSQENKIEKCACCTDVHKAFDFWIGDWTVYDNDGKIVGTNSIQKEYSNCVLKERWKSSGTTRGTSYNYYNTTDKTWNQVWIDNSGFSLELKGMYADGKMILISDLLKGDKGSFYHRITWVKNKDNTVTQIWDLLSENQEKMREVFKGIYKKNN